MNTKGSGLFRTTKYSLPTETVQQTTLSEFIGSLKIDRIKLMKMDVEGFEYEAILGSRELFKSRIIENIALELHPGILQQRGKSELDITNFLAECGYTRNEIFQTLVLSKKA